MCVCLSPTLLQPVKGHPPTDLSPWPVQRSSPSTARAPTAAPPTPGSQSSPCPTQQRVSRPSCTSAQLQLSSGPGRGGGEKGRERWDGGREGEREATIPAPTSAPSPVLSQHISFSGGPTVSPPQNCHAKTNKHPDLTTDKLIATLTNLSGSSLRKSSTIWMNWVWLSRL